MASFLSFGLSYYRTDYWIARIFEIYLHNHTRNLILKGLYAHGLANAFIPLMPTLIMQKNVPQPHFWIWGSLTFIIGIIITLMRDKKA
jgi:hypothetical protein